MKIGDKVRSRYDCFDSRGKTLEVPEGTIGKVVKLGTMKRDGRTWKIVEVEYPQGRRRVLATAVEVV